MVTDEFELRKCYSRLKRTRIPPHRVEEKEVEKSPDDDDEVISRSKKSIEVSVERTTKEVLVQNIQMIVEKIE